MAEEITTRHTNSTYLGETRLPESITATSSLAEAAAGADVVVLAVPAQHLRSHLAQLGETLAEDAVLVSLIKGLERGTDMRMSEVITAELGLEASRIAVVSGPNLAMEIAREEPTASVVACEDEQTAERIAALCNNPYFRPYTNTDVVGVEIAGIVKNVIALAVGICDGQSWVTTRRPRSSPVDSPRPPAWPPSWAGVWRPSPDWPAWGTWWLPAPPRCPATAPRAACSARA